MFIIIKTAPHPFFERRGKNLHLKTPVTLGEAAAGAKIDIPTPRGVVSLRVPPGTSSGAKLRVKGYGVAPRNEDPGDLLAEIQIVLPSELDEESRQWLQEFDRRHPLTPRRELRW